MGLKDEYSNDGEGFALDEYGIEPQDDSRAIPNEVGDRGRGPQETDSIDSQSVSEGAGRTQRTEEVE